MPGIPKKPIMILTKGAIQKLEEDELEWLILHEAGHCIHWHTLKDLFLWTLIFTSGLITIINAQPSLILTIIFAITLAIMWIQLERRHEIDADLFALKNGGSPKAMISFFQKMHTQYRGIISTNEILASILNSHPHYKKRIEMAKKYL